MRNDLALTTGIGRVVVDGSREVVTVPEVSWIKASLSACVRIDFKFDYTVKFVCIDWGGGGGCTAVTNAVKRIL